MALPRELRDQIYELALEPCADFLYTMLDRGNAAFSLPTMKLWGDQDSTEDNSNASRNRRRWSHSTGVLSFKLSTFTPLLLVSKDVQSEVRQVLRVLRPHFYRVIKKSIYLDRIVSPCPMFLDICSRSRFILDSYPENSFDLLQNLPSDVRPFVRNIIIMKDNVQDEEDAWSHLEDGRCKFTKALAEHLPNLLEVAISLPSTEIEARDFLYSAPKYLCDMLVRQEADVVRLLYCDNGDQDWGEWMYLEELVGPPSPKPTGHPRWWSHYGGESSGFHAWKETMNVDKYPHWKVIGVNRVAKITRWHDTER